MKQQKDCNGKQKKITDKELKKKINEIYESNNKQYESFIDQVMDSPSRDSVFRGMIRSNSLDSVKLMIKKKIDLNSRDENKLTPLMIALLEGSDEMIELLQIADFLARNKENFSQKINKE